jgi:hypothetical protein
MKALSPEPLRVVEGLDAVLSRWHDGLVFPVHLEFDHKKKQMHVRWEEYAATSIKALNRRIWRQVIRPFKQRLGRQFTVEPKVTPLYRQPSPLRARKLRANLSPEDARDVHLPAGLSQEETKMLQPLVDALVHSLKHRRDWLPCRSCGAPLPKWGTTLDCFGCRQKATPSRRARVAEWWRPKDPDEPDPRGRPPREIWLKGIYGRRRKVKPPKRMTLDGIMKDSFDDL